MKQWIAVFIAGIALMFSMAWVWLPNLTNTFIASSPSGIFPPLATTRSSTTDQPDISQYNAAPGTFTWIRESNEQLGISFERPSFWGFQKQVVNNKREYIAQFNRFMVASIAPPGKQQNEGKHILTIDYRPNILGTTPNATTGSPEDYLSYYFPVSSSSKAFRKTIGNIDVIKTYDPEPGHSMVGYVFFTTDNIIGFGAENADATELGIIEQMIASFKSDNPKEIVVTPNNFDKYPSE